MKDLFSKLQDWIAIDSVTGGEGDYADAVARYLTELGFSVERQEVAPGRCNLVAAADAPSVLFCTHLDTVPPWFGPSEDGDFIHGRGACDAKGVALAMMAAATRLVAEGERRVGFLLTIGEEVDFAGARHAADRVPEEWKPRYVLVGEPTENRFIRGHKGVFKARLEATGVAGHSSQDVGPSAVHELVGCVHGILGSSWGSHALFGQGSLNVGEISGGVAPNVVADRAHAEVLIRTVEESEAVEARLRTHLNERVSMSVDKSYGPQEFFVPPELSGSSEHDGGIVAFGTDAPFLGRWGTPLLCGPGRILDAHTDHERISKRAFTDSIELYRRTVTDLLREV